MNLQSSIQATTARHAQHYDATKAHSTARNGGRALLYGQAAAGGNIPATGLETVAPGNVIAHVAAATFYGDQYESSTGSTTNNGTTFTDALNAANDALAAEQAGNAYTYTAADGTQQTSYYDTATGRQYQDMTGHVSGYSGPGYYDEYGRAFTSYGSYLREDGFYYPSDAKISKNGMYIDTGSGWQFAKDCEAFGLAPGTRLDILPQWNFFGRNLGSE